MTIATEIKLRDFKFWNGAAQTRMYLTDKEVDFLETVLEDEHRDKPMTATEINDLFWFETNYIAEILGYEDWEALFNDGPRWIEEDE